MESTLRMKCRV